MGERQATQQMRQMVIAGMGRAPRESAWGGCPISRGSGALRFRWYQIENARHPTELRNGTSLHLPHQVRAMHLHRGFGDADIVGDLFVQATGHDMKHNLSFPRAKAIESLPECSQRLVTLPPGTIASESALDGFNELVITERFC